MKKVGVIGDSEGVDAGVAVIGDGEDVWTKREE